MRRSAGLLICIVCLSTCVRRDRVNTGCEWTHDPPRPLNLSIASDQKHLWDDAALAEDLSIRHADAEAGRRSGYVGHGGLLAHGTIRRGCEAKLFADVARAHGLTPDDVRGAVGHRSARFDVAVMLSFAAIYLWIACALTSRVFERFGDSRAMTAVLVTCGAVPVAAGGVVLGDLWSSTAEMIRVGNDHMGLDRQQRMPWAQHQPALFAAGVVLWFAAAAMATSRRGRTRAVAAMIAAIVCASGCVDRQRVNERCEWTYDAPRPLNLSLASDRQHLWDDASLAEDLAIRYADAEHGRRSGYAGHGGLLENGAVRHGCMERMFAAAARTHDLPIQIVRQNVGHRSAAFDAAVLVSFAAVYVWLATFAVGWIATRFGDSRSVTLAVTSVAGFAAALGGVLLGAIWMGIAEIVRVGNGHIAFRGARAPWAHHVSALFTGAVVLFWIVALRRGAISGRRILSAARK